MAQVERVIPYKPRDQFQPFHDRTQRWSILVAHRRAGKTVACINDIIKRAVENEEPHGRFAYVAPFLAQAKEIAWDYLKRYALPITRDKNEGELWIELVNGSRIRIHGADNPDRLRGAYLDGVVLDEYADMRPSIWGEVIRPMLTDRQGWATFIGTPKGKNEFWEKWDQAQNDNEWYSVMLKASETKLVPDSELQSARKDMTPEQYAQEFECSFEAAVFGAYYAAELLRATEDGRITRVGIDRFVPVMTAWDLGYTDSTAIWFVQAVGQELHWIDYYEANSQGLDHYANVLKEKLVGWGNGVRYGEHFFPHDIQAHMLGMDRSRIETLRSLGIEPTIIQPHQVNDGINATRRIFDRFWFDAEKCKRGVEALRQYRRDYDEKNRAFKPNPRHDWASHPADALRTFAAGWDRNPYQVNRVDRYRKERGDSGGSSWAA